jgi:ABC-type uncharacterized transport system permease subunit
MTPALRAIGAFLLALVASIGVIAVVALAVGENPWRAFSIIATGSLGSRDGIGFTLFYATTYTFTGLAVALPFRAGMFNIGAEGQASVAGIALSLMALHAGALPQAFALTLCALAAMAGGVVFCLLPAWLQVRRGSHIVIVTIMLNFVASALLSWLLVDVLRAPGSMQPESPAFPASVALPRLDQTTPLNVMAFAALAAALLCWLLLFRTRLGYRIRVLGLNPEAAVYAGYSPLALAMAVMAIAGLCGAGAAMNELLGAQGRLILDFMSGAGFVGIAVACMGRNHPLGVLPAALLFGILAQGGAELAFDMPRITRDTVVLIQGVVVLLVGGARLLPVATRRKI